MCYKSQKRNNLQKQIPFPLFTIKADKRKRNNNVKVMATYNPTKKDKKGFSLNISEE